MNVKKTLIDFEIICRLHPSVPLIDIERYSKEEGITIDNNEDILDQLIESICCVGITSSALLEGLLSYSIPISFSSGCLKHSIAFEKNKVGMRLETKTETIDVILELAKLDVVYKIYLKNIKQQKIYLFTKCQDNLCNFSEKLEVRNESF